jgi:hypothetical protein
MWLGVRLWHADQFDGAADAWRTQLPDNTAADDDLTMVLKFAAQSDIGCGDAWFAPTPCSELQRDPDSGSGRKGMEHAAEAGRDASDRAATQWSRGR